MAIKPPSFDLPPPPTSAAGGGRRAEAAERFRELLAQAGARQEGEAPAPTELAAVLRLQMLQQAIRLADQEDDGESVSDLFTLLPAPDLPAWTPPCQNVDPPVKSPPPVPVAPASGRDPLAAIIDRAAARHQVAAPLIRAVIAAESSFNPQAVSPAGAQGLMQLMPATARELGVTDPFDPEQNVMAGTRYLKQMLQRYDGDLEKTLAAYNWGPGNLARSADGRLPGETRRYIAKIKETLGR